MKKIFFIFFCITTLSLADSYIDRLEGLYNSYNFIELEQAVNNALSMYMQNPDYLFFTAVIEPNGEKALQIYEEIFTQHPSSKFADAAIYNAGLYHYSTGNYNKARKLFSRLVKGYPNSEFKDDCQYLFCQVVSFQGKPDSARIYLQAFLKHSKDNGYAEYAIQDLKELTGKTPLIEQPDNKVNEKPEPVKEPEPQKEPYFSIQIGAFSVKENAFKVREKFQENFNVEIVIRYVKQQKYYAVWVEKFETREEALSFYQKNRSKLGDKVQFVKRSY